MAVPIALGSKASLYKRTSPMPKSITATVMNPACMSKAIGATWLIVSPSHACYNPGRIADYLDATIINLKINGHAKR